MKLTNANAVNTSFGAKLSVAIATEVGGRAEEESSGGGGRTKGFAGRSTNARIFEEHKSLSHVRKSLS